MDILYSKLQRYQIFKTIRLFNTIRSKSRAVDLAYSIHGPSPLPNSVPILVLHGFLGSKKNWDSMCKKITSSTNRPVIAVDSRNHGDSPHDPSNTYHDLVADVSKLIDRLPIDKVIIIGHSLGGRTGMLLSLTEPSKVAGLVVVDISPVSSPGTNRDFFIKVMETMITVDFKDVEDLHKAETAAVNKLVTSGLIDEKNKGALHFIIMNVGKLPDGSFGWKCNVAALVKHFRDLAIFPDVTGKQFKGPTLFIGGTKSWYIPPEDITGIRKLFPLAQLHYIDCGHTVHIEDPTAFYNIVVDFLSCPDAAVHFNLK